MNDLKDSKPSETTISRTRTDRALVRALLIDVHVKRIVDVYMTPSYEEVVKLVGSSFFVPHRLDCLRGDTLYCDEGSFPPPYQNFSVDGVGVTGNGLVVGRTHDHILVDCQLELGDLAKLVKWS